MKRFIEFISYSSFNFALSFSFIWNEEFLNSIFLKFINISILNSLSSLESKVNLNKILKYLFSSNSFIFIDSFASLFIIKLFSLSILKETFFDLSLKFNSSKPVVCSELITFIIFLGTNLIKSKTFNELSSKINLFFLFSYKLFLLFCILIEYSSVFVTELKYI